MEVYGLFRFSRRLDQRSSIYQVQQWQAIPLCVRGHFGTLGPAILSSIGGGGCEGQKETMTYRSVQLRGCLVMVLLLL